MFCDPRGKGNMTKQERASAVSPGWNFRDSDVVMVLLVSWICFLAISNQTHNIVEYVQYYPVYPCTCHLLAWTCGVDFHVDEYHADPFESLMFPQGLLLPILSLHIVAASLSVFVVKFHFPIVFSLFHLRDRC